MKLKFSEKKQEAGDVWSFFFEPVDKLEWIAGQSVRLELPRPTWGIDERRFTIASAPHEKHIQIATKLSGSSFKQSLDKLQPGQEINAYNIEGDFVWGPEDQHRLFLAGGIGITPFRSLVAARIHDKQPLNATLIASSATSPVLFQNEFDAWQQQDGSLKTHFMIGTRIEVADNSTLAAQWLSSLVYVSGPDKMVESLSKALVQHGLPKEQLRQDLFTGHFD